MPKEIVEKIKLAEEEAIEIRRKAETEAKDRIAAAGKQSEKIYLDAIKAAEEENEKNLESAKEAAKARIDENRRVSYENAAKVTEIASGNTEKAVEIVMNAVLCS